SFVLEAWSSPRPALSSGEVAGQVGARGQRGSAGCFPGLAPEFAHIWTLAWREAVWRKPAHGVDSGWFCARLLRHRRRTRSVLEHGVLLSADGAHDPVERS